MVHGTGNPKTCVLVNLDLVSIDDPKNNRVQLTYQLEPFIETKLRHPESFTSDIGALAYAVDREFTDLLLRQPGVKSITASVLPV